MDESSESDSEKRKGKANTSTIPSVWGNRTFVALFIAQAGSLTGSGISSVALGLLAYELVDASVSEVVGVLLTIRIVSRVFVSVWASEIASFLGTKMTMLVCDVVSALAVLGFFFASTVWEIYALSALLSLCSAIFTPLYKATIPRVVTTQQYPRAVSYSSIAYDIANIGGPALSGVLVMLVGVRGNFLFNTATYLISALIIWWVPRAIFQHMQKKEAEKTKQPDKKRDVWRGVRAVLKRPILREATLLSWHPGMSGALILVATVDYVKTTLGGTDPQYAWAMTSYGIGSLLGALIYSQLSERIRGWVIAFTPWMLAATLIVVTLAPSYMLLLACWIVAGAGGVMITVRSNQYLAENSKPEERESVYAAQFSISHIIWLFTYPLAGYLTTVLGFYGTCWVFAAGDFTLIVVRRILHKPSTSLDNSASS